MCVFFQKGVVTQLIKHDCDEGHH